MFYRKGICVMNVISNDFRPKTDVAKQIEAKFIKSSRPTTENYNIAEFNYSSCGFHC